MGELRRGFTLLELIVVLLVLGVLSAIAIPTFSRIQENSLRSSVSGSIESVARNANGIAQSDTNAAGKVTAAILDLAWREAGLQDPVLGNSARLTMDSGSKRCAAVVAIVSGRAVAGPVSCGEELLAYPEGYVHTPQAPNENLSGLAVAYPDTVFPMLEGEYTTLRPMVTGASTRVQQLGTGCAFEGVFYTQSEWEGYGLVASDCDPQGGIWHTDYARTVPNTVFTVVAGELPEGFTLDAESGAITSPDSWQDPDPRVPFMLTLQVSDPAAGSTSTTVTFTAQ